MINYNIRAIYLLNRFNEKIPTSNQNKLSGE